MGTEADNLGWSHILVESSPLEGLLVPLKRSARLRYTCLSVSKKLVALGSNTGGVYVFSRGTLKHLHVVFGEKETSPVAMVRLSPNDRYVGFTLSSGSVYVMELKLDYHSKPECVRHVTDHVGAMVTALHWDATCTKLYSGDDLGRVIVIQVKTVFSLPSEVIMKLDSSVIQIDTADDKLLVSTLTRCYLCDTNKHQYSQIGKKLRDGKFGACFYQQFKSHDPVIYSARPSSRIWEVDFQGTVLNTHMFKQLLSVPALPVVNLQSVEDSSRLPDRNTPSLPQSLTFSKLYIISDQFLVTLISGAIYIFDPVSVKVVLWSQTYSGVQDMCCCGSDVFVFLNSMEVKCLHLVPAVGVISLCLAKELWVQTANYCCFFEKAFDRKARKIVSFSKLRHVHEKLVKMGKTELGEKFHQVLLRLESSAISSSEAEFSDSSRSRSSSSLSAASAGAGTQREPVLKRNDSNVLLDGESSKPRIPNRAENVEMAKLSQGMDNGQELQVEPSLPLNQVREKSHGARDEVDVASELPDLSDPPSAMLEFDANVSETSVGIMGATGVSVEKEESDISEVSIQADGSSSEELASSMTDFSAQGLQNSSNALNGPDAIITVDQSGRSSVASVDQSNGSAVITIDQSGGSAAISNNQSSESAIIIDNQSGGSLVISDNQSDGSIFDSNKSEHINVTDGSNPSETSSIKSIESDTLTTNQEICIQVDDYPNYVLSNSDQSSTIIEEKPIDIDQSHGLVLDPDQSKSAGVQDVDDDTMEMEYVRSANTWVRRPSLSSLSSLSSNEFFVDSTGNTPTAVRVDGGIVSPGPRKTRKKKRTVEAVIRSPDSNQTQDVPKRRGKVKRSQSVGSLPKYSISQSPQHLTIHEDGITDISPQKTSASYEGEKQRHHPSSLPVESSYSSYMRDRRSPVASALQDLDLSLSGEFMIGPDISPSDSPLSQSWDSNRSDAVLSQSPKIAFKQIRDKVQNKLTTKTKQLIRTIQEKNILPKTTGRDGLAGTPEMESVVIAKEPEKSKPMENVPMSRHPIDISELEDSTFSTKKKLQELSTLMKPDLVYDILLSWIKILNKTMQKLHEVRYMNHNQSSFSASNSSEEAETEIVSDPGSIAEKQEVESGIVGNADLGYHGNRDRANSAAGADCPEETSEISDQNGVETVQKVSNLPRTIVRSDGKMTSIAFERKVSKLDDKDKDDKDSSQVVCPHHKSFCYVKDPLCLDAETLKTVCFLNEACFDINCHGNILSYVDRNTINSAKQRTVQKFQRSADADRETTEVCEQSEGDGDQIVGQGCVTLKPEGEGQIETSSEQTKAQCNCSNQHICDKCSLKGIKHTDQNESCDHVIANHHQSCEDQGQGYIGELNSAVNPTSKISDLSGGNISGLDPGQMSCFIRWYFPYLKVSRVREAVQSHDRTVESSFLMWCALVGCLNVLYGTESKDKSEIQDIISPGRVFRGGIDALLSLIVRLCEFSPAKSVELCVQYPFSIQPLDVLFMCRLHGLSVEEHFHKYMTLRLRQAKQDRTGTLIEICSHPVVKDTWLNILLSEGMKDTGVALCDTAGQPRPGSHKNNRRTLDVVHDILEHCTDTDTEHYLDKCRNKGYWSGCLLLLKKIVRRKEHMKMILQLGDLDLLSRSHPLGYLPANIKEWEELLSTYAELMTVSKKSEDQGDVSSDWSAMITLDNIGLLLVKHVGPESAVRLLQENNIPECSLSSSFYQSCILAGMVKKHQRLVLHSMVEKIDTYLWSQRPGTLSPPLLYAMVKEKSHSTSEQSHSASEQTGAHSDLEALFARLKSQTESSCHQLAEDPDCHWGVAARINSVCPCCNIALKETVSHIEPGVIVYKCGHGYHRFCVPEKECLVCLDSSNDG